MSVFDPRPGDEQELRDDGYDEDEIRRLTGEEPDAKKRPAERHRGQLRMAERFAHQHAGRLLHVHRVGWYVWDSIRWRPDENGAPIRAVRDTLNEALSELAGLPKQDREELFKDIARCESATAINGILTIAGSDEQIATAPSKLDTDPHLVNCQNGTLDLRTGDLRPHDPGDLITKATGCEFDWNARSAIFEKFVGEILPDDDVRAFVQRLLGQSMLGIVREHILAILTGTGSNGKSTLTETVRAALGDYAMEAEPELLLTREHAHPTGQADLMGRRLVTVQETDEGRKLATATVKRLTGGDQIRARRMRQDFFEFTPSHTIVMITNHKPRVAGDDDALWRRLRVVPFDMVVDKPDKTLLEKLKADLPGVLSWLVYGFMDYTDKGLEAPSTVTEQTQKYRDDSDAPGRFLEERTIPNPNMWVGARDLFRAWEKWATANGETLGTEVGFAESMARRGIDKKKSNKGARYLGIGLAAEEDSSDRGDGW